MSTTITLLPNAKDFKGEQPEGVLYQTTDRGSALNSGALSVTEIEVLDLLSEGEIEGLVSGEYPLTGVSGVAGNVGWNLHNFAPFPNAPNTSANYLRSIFWNEVPLISSDNRYNYQNISFSYTKGLPNGALLDQTKPELTISRVIGERLRGSNTDSLGNPLSNNADYIKYYRIFNKECNGAYINVRFNVLSEINNQVDQKDPTFGFILGTTVEYKIYYRPLFGDPNRTPVDFTLGVAEKVQGKITYGYIKQSKVLFITNYTDFNDFLGWEIKIVRLTPDYVKDSATRNQTYIDSLTEIYSNTFTYPNSAVCRAKFSAEFFSQVPDRAFRTRLLKVKIPDNYDPNLKSYTEGPNGWSGLFASGKYWTDNPAWCYYDLITNKRYGLGNYIGENQVDKWTLYEIGKYCDTLVPDGYGHLEPRFSCNLIINSREEAYKVVNDVASVFRGITYYAGGTIFPVQDSPKNPIYTFTNANVEQGNFNYSTSSKRARNSIAIVRFNDKDNFYKPAVEYVENVDAIRQYGIRERDITAFGCTSRGQANRWGQYLLLSENLETETVSFNGGMECSFLRPGDVFKIFDANKKVTRYAGRTVNINNYQQVGFTGSIITLDDEFNLNANTLYSFSILAPTYYYNPLNVYDISGANYSDIRRNQLQNKIFTGLYASGVTGDGVGRTQITFYTPFDTGNANVSGNLIWSIELQSGFNNTYTGISTYQESISYINKNADYYRAIQISEKAPLQYEVIGVQYSPQKYDLIESGLTFEQPPTLIDLVPTSPQNLIVAVDNITKNSKKIDFSFTTQNYSGITSYKVFAKQGVFSNNNVPADDFLVASLPTDSQSASFNVYQTGNYFVRVYSVNDNTNVYSTGFTTGYALVDSVNPIRDIIINSLRLDTDPVLQPFSGATNTGYYITDSPVFKWQVGQQPDSTIPFNYNYRISIREPSFTNIPSNNIYFQNTGYSTYFGNPQYQFPLGLNTALSGGPYRSYDFVVEAIDASGNTSAGNSISSGDGGWAANPDGYDILYLSNPDLTGIFLSTGGANINYDTSQWINADGSINLLIRSGQLDPKVRGGFIYANTSGFVSGDIYSGSNNVLSIQMAPFTANSNFFTSATQFNFYNSGWMAVGFYDSFGQAFLDKGIDISRGLSYSNIVPVYGSGNLYDLRTTNSVAVHNKDFLGERMAYKTMRSGVGSNTYYVHYGIDDRNRNIIASTRQV